MKLILFLHGNTPVAYFLRYINFYFIDNLTTSQKLLEALEAEANNVVSKSTLINFIVFLHEI